MSVAVDQLLAIISSISSRNAEAGVKVPEFGVTMVVNGVLVTGTLIGAAEFYERFPRDMYESLGMTIDEKSESYNLLKETLQEFYRRSPKSGNDEPEMGRFLYMKDAIIVGPGGIRLNTDIWKGRLDHVSGWAMGRLNFEPPGNTESEVSK